MKEIYAVRDAIKSYEHPIRQRILEFLENDGEQCVSEIINKLQIEQPLVSQHLKSLRNANLVITRRCGRFIYYSKNTQLLKKLHSCCKDFMLTQQTLNNHGVALPMNEVIDLNNDNTSPEMTFDDELKNQNDATDLNNDNTSPEMTFDNGTSDNPTR